MRGHDSGPWNHEWHGEDGWGWTVQSLLRQEPEASEAGMNGVIKLIIIK